MARKLAYIAAPLFSEGEKVFNLVVSAKISKLHDTFLPQRDGGLFAQKVGSGLSVEIAAKMVFDTDLAAIRRCDLLVAILDGRCIDEGVAFELGFAYSLGKTCIALQTDTRRLLPIGNNPMISCAVSKTFDSCESLVDALQLA